jgi:hypothetical protein
MTEFHQTRMGQQFYDRTVPELVRQLQRLNENLERRDLQQATADLVAAAERVLDTEIVPGSKATIEAFDELRRAVREAREAVRESVE